MKKQLDLLLVNAPSSLDVYNNISPLAALEPPVWAGLIARHCLNKGYSVQLLDAEAEGLDAVSTANGIRDANPRLAAFCVYGHQPSASTQCMPGASYVASLVKGQVPTLALGTHPSALPEKTLHEGAFDFVCQGEGPHTITVLIVALQQGLSFDHPLPFSRRPPGLLWGMSRTNSYPSTNITDLDKELPGQAWELLDMTKYHAHQIHLWTGDPDGGYASVQTSLGCSFSCTFCCIQTPFGNESPRMRYWSPKNVVDQIEHLVRKYEITNIKIPDEMFVLNRNHVRAICEDIVARGLGDILNMWAYARVDTVKDKGLLMLMRAAGFRSLGMGIESGSKHVRDGAEKGKFDNEGIINAVRRVQNHGIAVGANYIFGLPDDTKESMQATLDLAYEINSEWANFYCAMAYPGSELHRIAERNGWRLPEDPDGPGWIGYSQHAYESLPLRTETLHHTEVLDFRDNAHLHYFSRPEYLKMLEYKFSQRAVRDVEAMLMLGRPQRKHRESGGLT